MPSQSDAEGLFPAEPDADQDAISRDLDARVLLGTTEAPLDTVELRRGLRAFFDRRLSDWPDLFPDPPMAGGRRPKAITLGSVKWGVYAFFDYDDEPIYVGQTKERLSGRVSRHLTNQRTDAVAMSVLDPYEVRRIKVWPLPEYQDIVKRHQPDAWAAAKRHLDGLELHVFNLLISQSKFGAILNEKNPIPGELPHVPPMIDEPPIVSGTVAAERSHPDTRIARRAMIISRLAQVIAERELRTPGLRRTLATQADRLQWLARERYVALGGEGMIETGADEDSE
ncbi:GIY-YIG nuclease family protein [Qipengyuania sp. YG27]|uniref:GIY-YIG nuclease family protein n=1 Tax=Qipengyuania mesophila TaxID=2867246 RepID=A0ABS7JUP5_9SPHN|nr:GIY-YIG nuclease family protein [Qipengyuania mesophila]MBX7501360.1 GIY-YIG nuclease family protein [Qipengyuania mesophila]